MNNQRRSLLIKITCTVITVESQGIRMRHAGNYMVDQLEVRLKRVGPSRVQANIAEIVETSRETASGEALFSDEIQHLYRLLNKLDSSNVATSNYVQSDPKWKQAMIEEMKALSKNKTWELVTSPPDKKFVCCKWVFTVKHKADGSIERFKAKLVAKGFTQTYGVDYQETFGPCCQNEHYQNHFVLCS
ncbi:uncharacterized protein LOC142162860 [Nicotiana tabacum]|uniref:Uncharacterized protein LOC142162860 n=1 Tax=Nicotiana tabacum TaxID=4097 RepID=A0AC58RTC4_TOBAC